MKDRNILVFFVLSILLALVICFVSFCYWEIIDPIKDDPYYEEPIPNNWFE